MPILPRMPSAEAIHLRGNDKIKAPVDVYTW